MDPCPCLLSHYSCDRATLHLAYSMHKFVGPALLCFKRLGKGDIVRLRALGVVSWTGGLTGRIKYSLYGLNSQERWHLIHLGFSGCTQTIGNLKSSQTNILPKYKQKRSQADYYKDICIGPSIRQSKKWPEKVDAHFYATCTFLCWMHISMEMMAKSIHPMLTKIEYTQNELWLTD